MPALSVYGSTWKGKRHVIRAVLLDLFGTVVAYGDVEEGTRLAWEGVYAIVKELGANPPFDAFSARWQEHLTRPLAPGEDMAETPFISKLLRLFRAYHLPEDYAAARRAGEACLKGWESFLALTPDTIPTLRALHERYALALVSNFDHPPYVHQMLRTMELEPCFDYIVVSGDIRIDKPDPRIYHLALQALRASPAEGAFVGDSLSTDIAGALAVGLRPILIDMQGWHPDYAGERITSLSELPALLDGRE